MWWLMELKDVPGVYYRIVKEDNERNVAYSVLKNDKVSVKGEITKTQMEELNNKKKFPTLKITAYASQLKNNNKDFSAEEAWKNIK